MRSSSATLAVLVGCLPLLSGCHTSPRERLVLQSAAMTGIPLEKEDPWSYEPPQKWELDKLNAAEKELYKKVQYYNKLKHRPFDEEALKGFAPPDPSDVLAELTQLRNEIAAVMLAQAVHFQAGMTRDVFEVTSELETGFDLVGLVLNATGAVTGGAVDKAAYNAAAGAVLGLRNSLGKNILAEQTKFAILSQMEALWLKKNAEILTNLNAKKDDVYSLQEVAEDIRQLTTSAWLQNAVAELARTATNAKADAEEKVKAAKESKK